MDDQQGQGWPTNIEALHALLDGYQAQVFAFQEQIIALELLQTALKNQIRRNALGEEA